MTINNSKIMTVIDAAMARLDITKKEILSAEKELLELREQIRTALAEERKLHSASSTTVTDNEHPCFIENNYLEHNLTQCCDMVLDYIMTCEYETDLKRLAPNALKLKRSPIGWLWKARIREFSKNSQYDDLETPDDVMRLGARIKPFIHSEITSVKWGIDYRFLEMFKEETLQAVVGDPRLSNENVMERNVARYRLLVEMIRHASVDKFESGLMIGAKTLKQIETFIYPSRFVKAMRINKQNNESVRIGTFRSYLLNRSNKLAQRDTEIRQERQEKRQMLLTGHVFKINQRHTSGKPMIGGKKNQKNSTTPASQQQVFNGTYLCRITVEQKGTIGVVYRIINIIKPDVQRNSGVIWAYVVNSGSVDDYNPGLEEEFTYEEFMSTQPKEVLLTSPGFLSVFPNQATLQPTYYSENKSTIAEYHKALPQ
jgi:hypothetical protein